MIIPIGTKSSLALKPIITIGLIAINIIIAVITLPLTGHMERRIFETQKERYAVQLKLYLIEHGGYDNSYSYMSRYVEDSLKRLEECKDYTDFEIELFGVLSMLELTFEELEEYGAILEERGDEYYESRSYSESEAFYEWQALVEKEEKVFFGHVNFAFGLKPDQMGRFHTFFTYQFLHGDLWHLLGNILFLWVVGCLLEDSWGRIPFLAFYLLGGAFAGLAHCLQDTSSSIPLIGASGSIAAAMGAFAIRHFWTRIKFFYFFILLFRPFWGTFFLPAYVFLPFWFIEQLVMKSLSDFVGASGVAYMAHIAGFAAGVTVAVFLRYSGFEEKFLAPRVQNKQIDAGVLKDPRFNDACDLMERGETEKAKSIFAQLVREKPDNVDLLQDIAIMYKERGLIAECGEIAENALKGLMLRSQYGEAAGMTLRMIEGSERPRLSAQPLLRIAKWLADNEQFGEAHDVYRYILSSDIPTNVYVKASIGLSILLAERLSNPSDAIEILKDAEYLDLDADQSKRINDVFARITELFPQYKSCISV